MPYNAATTNAIQPCINANNLFILINIASIIFTVKKCAIRRTLQHLPRNVLPKVAGIYLRNASRSICS